MTPLDLTGQTMTIPSLGLVRWRFCPRRSVWAVAVLTLMSGCSWLQPSPPAPPPIAGFQCLPTPSEWNAAGSVFGIDRNGTPFQLGAVPNVVPQYGAGVIGAYTKDSKVEAGFVLKTLEDFTERKGWSGNVGANLKSVVTIGTSYGGETRMAITVGQPEDAAQVWFKTSGFRVEDGFKYFLVREAYQAKEVIFEVKRDDLAKLGGDAVVKAVEGKFNIFDGSNKDSYLLKAKLPTFVNVCIKPREIVVTGAGATGQQTFGFRDPIGPILPVK